MRKLLFFIFLLLLSNLKVIAQSDTIFATIDLKNLQNDKSFVDIRFNSLIQNKNLTFYFPISIPGTYEDLNYSKYISNFMVFGENNETLSFTKKIIHTSSFPDDNEIIKIGKKRSKEYFFIPSEAKRITYFAADAYDKNTNGFPNFISEANIFEKDRVYQLNWGAILGNFTISNRSVYQISVIKPKGIYGATSLTKVVKNDTLEILYSKNYSELIDQPIFYTKPDTSTFRIGRSLYEVSVFSENGEKYSEKIAKKIQPMILEANRTYLKGITPERYVFMYYFTPSFGMGALEHKSSSMYFLSAPDTSLLNSGLLETTAHEYLHVLTPLTVRSEKISNFKLYAPYETEHLWMFEGITEYFSYLLLLQTKDIKPEIFFTNMGWNYKDALKRVSLTKISKNIHQKRWNKKFGLVYSKGSLTAFALDLEIYNLTNGKLRLYDVMMMLKEKYKNKAFSDRHFIDEFVKITKKQELKSFFDNYIIGKKKLPVNQYFHKIGFEYKTKTDTFQYSSNGIGFGQSYKGTRVFIRKPNKKFYPEIKGKAKIEILSINGNKNVFTNHAKLWSLKEGDYIEYNYKKNIRKLVIKTEDITKIRARKKFSKVDKPTNRQKELFEEFFKYKFDNK